MLNDFMISCSMKKVLIRRCPKMVKNYKWRNEYLVTVGWNSLNVGWNFSCNEMVIRRLMLRRYMTFTNVTWSWNDSIRVTKWPFNNYIFHKTDCTYPLHENYLWRHLGHFFSKKFEFTHSPSTQPLYNHQHPTQPQHHHISPKQTSASTGTRTHHPLRASLAP